MSNPIPSRIQKMYDNNPELVFVLDCVEPYDPSSRAVSMDPAEWGGEYRREDDGSISGRNSMVINVKRFVDHRGHRVEFDEYAGADDDGKVLFSK